MLHELPTEYSFRRDLHNCTVNFHSIRFGEYHQLIVCMDHVEFGSQSILELSFVICMRKSHKRKNIKHFFFLKIKRLSCGYKLRMKNALQKHG